MKAEFTDRGIQRRASGGDSLPPWFIEGAPAELVEAERALREALAVQDRAHDAAAETRCVAEEAPNVDAAADFAPFAAGRKQPTPTRAKAREASDAAERRYELARGAAGEALDARDAAVVATVDELLASSERDADRHRAEAAACISELAASVAGHDQAVAALTVLHAYKAGAPRRLDRLTGQGGGSSRLLAGLLAEMDGARAAAVPLSAKILDLVGQRGATWDSVADRLGVNKIDPDARSVRDWLVDDGELAWVDQDGAPIAARQRGSIAGQRLIKSVPPESPVARARRERWERQVGVV